MDDCNLKTSMDIARHIWWTLTVGQVHAYDVALASWFSPRCCKEYDTLLCLCEWLGTAKIAQHFQKWSAWNSSWRFCEIPFNLQHHSTASKTESNATPWTVAPRLVPCDGSASLSEGPSVSPRQMTETWVMTVREQAWYHISYIHVSSVCREIKMYQNIIFLYLNHSAYILRRNAKEGWSVQIVAERKGNESKWLNKHYALSWFAIAGEVFAPKQSIESAKTLIFGPSSSSPVCTLSFRVCSA